MKLSFNLGDYRYILSSKRFKRPKEWTFGLTSVVPYTNLHILLMDYDVIREDFLMGELIHLQEAFELGNFYIFRTRLEQKVESYTVADVEIEGTCIGGYHCICLDMDTTRNISIILKCSRTDYAFRNAPWYNPEKHWVLRLGEKGKRGAPEYVGVLESPYEGKRLQSTFHARLLEDYLGIEIESKLKSPNGGNVGIVDYYNTGKRI